MESTYKERIDQLITRILTKEEALSYSSLSQFAKSPKSFIEYKFREIEPTDAMKFGILLHEIVLTPNSIIDGVFNFESISSKYVVVPDNAPKRPTKAQINAKKPSEDSIKAIAWWNEFNETTKGKEVISQSELDEAVRTAKAVLYNRSASMILSQCTEFEKKMEWEYNNFKFVGYVDAQGEKIRADLKKCTNASPKKFQRTALDSNYHIQAALYTYADGLMKPFYNIAVDSDYQVSTHKINLDLIKYGKKEVDRILEAFNRCILEDAWNQSFEFYSDRYDGSYDFDKPAYLY